MTDKNSSHRLSPTDLFTQPSEETIETDDASCAAMPQHIQPTTALLAANLRTSKSPQHSLSPSHQHSSSRASPNIELSSRRIDYNRLDSGICEDMRSIKLNDSGRQSGGGGKSGTNSSLTSPQRHQQQQQAVVTASPSASFIEYYDADPDGDCQLHLAIASGYTEVVFALIRMAPHPSYLDIQNNELYAPLHISVLMNHAAMVRRLVVAGATTDIRDRDGNTPLHLAAKRGHIKCAEALLCPISADEIREAAVPGLSNNNNGSGLRSILDLKNYHGEHSVHLATFGQHYEFIRFLRYMEADLNTAEGRSGKTALHYAVNKRDIQMTGILASPKSAGGCSVQLNCRDWAGRSPYECAKINGDHDIAAMLASLPGCDTNTNCVDLDEDYEFDTDDENMSDTEVEHQQHREQKTSLESARVLESRA